ncbi:hypothetical protein [Brachybacterium phenoliresistens]|uniref:Uncharacterized protein n=1 Tax=Brachybacterium phenoliresistens TaxID=396014 RepID=Z9JSF5_9MICO|nr:hypothetical protein [Brachybacterium phenoliresistens]EWS81119.1 hypothetical protein BF93_18270 [Brachybacterium phenoliresistens]
MSAPRSSGPGAHADLWERADGRSTLAAVQEAWGARRGTRGAGEKAYLVYLVVMSVLILGYVPARAVMQALAGPELLPLIAAPRAPQLLTTLWLLACAGAALAGGLRGPVVLSPFFTATIAASAMPRHIALRWPLLRCAALLAGTGATAGAVIGGARAVAGIGSAGDALLLSLACLGAGLVVIGPWMLGEVLAPAVPEPGRPRRRILGGPQLAAAFAAAAGCAAATATPWGIGAVLDPATTAPEAAAWAFALVLAGASTVVLCLTALDQLHGRVLAEQAARWSAATTSALTGDLAAGSGAFRMPPRAGRRLRAVEPVPAGPLTLVLLYLRRDLVALLRTPARLVTGMLTSTAAAALLLASAALPGVRGWLGVLTAAALAWAASSAVTDGLRHAVATLGAPPLLGQGVRAQLALHLTAPLLALLLAGAAGGGAAILAGADAGGLLPVLLLTAVTVLGRARDAAKGPMPLRLAAPMPTAMGDASVIPMLLWQGDALLRALGAAVLVVLANTVAPWGSVLAALAVLVLLTLELAHRIREATP